MHRFRAPIPMTLLLSVALTACGGSGGGGSGADGTALPGTPLVTVHIGDLTGEETTAINSATHPRLFELDPRISFAEVSFANGDATVKDDATPGTFRPAVSPVPPAREPGFLELLIVTEDAVSVPIAGVRCTTSAQVASNPSSLRLSSSDDGFTATLFTFDLASERTETVPLVPGPVTGKWFLHWTAASDFGDQGGGNAGFSSRDLILFE